MFGTKHEPSLEESVGDAIATQKNPFRLRPVHFIPLFGLWKYVFPTDKQLKAMHSYEMLEGEQEPKTFINCGILIAYHSAVLPVAALGEYVVRHWSK